MVIIATSDAREGRGDRVQTVQVLDAPVEWNNCVLLWSCTGAPPWGERKRPQCQNCQLFLQERCRVTLGRVAPGQQTPERNITINTYLWLHDRQVTGLFSLLDSNTSTPRKKSSTDRNRTPTRVRKKGRNFVKIPKNLTMRILGSLFEEYFYLLILLQFLIQPGECRQHFVTCGSVIKLMNTDYRVRLHSHDVKYGTGSGQQSVTATEVQEDNNSHWLIKASAGKVCLRGDPIACGTNIRLEHVETKKNLHSHYFSSPLSANQEISAYGDDKGEGDSGDNWSVICSGDSWRRDDSVMLRHVDTQMYLAISGRTFGRPINGQMEVVGIKSSTGAVHWQTMEGVYLHAPDVKHQAHVHTEL